MGANFSSISMCTYSRDPRIYIPHLRDDFQSWLIIISAPRSADLVAGTAEWPLSCHRLSSPDPSLVGFKDDLKITSPRHSNAGFSKFSRFLNSNAASKPDDISIFLGAERRHSWER